MKKQKIQLIVLILVLAALAGSFFAVRKYKETQAEKPVEEDGIAVLEVRTEDVINIIYDYEGETYQYEKVDGTWYFAQDHTQNVKQYYLSGMATGASSLIASQVLEDVKDLSQYGLDTPQQTIIFDTAVQRFRVNVGDANSMTSSYYIQLPEKPDTVYIVPNTCITPFQYGPENIIEVQEDEAGTEGTGTESGSGTETESGSGTGTESGSGTGTEAGAGTDTGSDVGTE